MSPHGIIALLHLARILVAGHVKDPSQSTSYYISCAKPGLDLILPGVQLVRLRVNQEKRSSGWEMFWFLRILSIANPTGENRNLSALTSFWAWFMICTINVSMLIISWKMDLRGWEIERKRKILRQDKVNTADSTFMFWFFRSFKINGRVGQGGEDGLVWSGLC